jgi:hypothetical protein
MKFAFSVEPATVLGTDVAIGPEADSIDVGGDTDRVERGAPPMPDARRH